MTFRAASAHCIKLNMTLLEIDSEEMLELVYDRTENVFSTGGGTTIWINGWWMQSKEGWFSHPSERSFYLTEALKDSHKLVKQFGMCLGIQSYFEQYETVSMRCSIDCYFYCGF
jgi:hypothetical protein